MFQQYNQQYQQQQQQRRQQSWQQPQQRQQQQQQRRHPNYLPPQRDAPLPRQQVFGPTDTAPAAARLPPAANGQGAKPQQRQQQQQQQEGSGEQQQQQQQQQQQLHYTHGLGQDWSLPTGLAVTWLGSSSGTPTRDRNVSCTVLQQPGSLCLVDVGEGSSRQMRLTGLQLDKVCVRAWAVGWGGVAAVRVVGATELAVSAGSWHAHQQLLLPAPHPRTLPRAARAACCRCRPAARHGVHHAPARRPLLRHRLAAHGRVRGTQAGCWR
jgi:hypothetical protein